jgi:hypothetical protein
MSVILTGSNGKQLTQGAERFDRAQLGASGVDLAICLLANPLSVAPGVIFPLPIEYLSQDLIGENT